ncbi:MAG: thiol:disulfide interchange protein DsbA/DsbL [Gammaproteobacteria bacterium]|nr:MAG: thiol:disulfide interchange protein DsbA/DsbL [Gammaproteobacteria bacterium]
MKHLVKAFVVLMVVFGISVSANAKEFKKFEPIQTPQPTNDPSKVEVLSIFAYSCGHCYNFHSQHLDHWEKPSGIDYMGVPALFNQSNEHLVRAYHTAVILGIVDEYHPAVFTTYRKNKQAVKDKAALAKFATAYGVTEKDFLDTYESFAVEVKVSQAKQIMKSYRVHSVPTVIINGKYKVSAAITGSHAKVIESMDELISKEKSALGISEKKSGQKAEINAEKKVAKADTKSVNKAAKAK